MATETVTQAPDALAKLHRASCIVAYIANNMLDADQVLPGETLKAAEELILAAMETDREEAASSTPATAVAPRPDAFAGWDSTMYMAWVRALSDMMLSKADPGQMAEHTLANYGGLLHALTEAAEEMQASERKALLERKAATA